MEISNQNRAQVLVQALPYIQKYAGKTVVVKYGGNAMINNELKDAVMSDLVLMQLGDQRGAGARRRPGDHGDAQEDRQGE